MSGSGRVERWVERWGAHPLGPAALFAAAVLEACLFPAPTEAVFLALALARPRRAWRLAALATAGGVVGAGVGYWIGASFFERVGQPVLEWYGLFPRFEAVGALFRENLLLALATSGYTPVPWVLYTIAAGAFGVPLLPFLLGAAVGRGVKYGILAGLAWYLGPRVRAFLERHLLLFAAAVTLVVIVLVLLRT